MVCRLRTYSIDHHSIAPSTYLPTLSLLLLLMLSLIGQEVIQGIIQSWITSSSRTCLWSDSTTIPTCMYVCMQACMYVLFKETCLPTYQHTYLPAACGGGAYPPILCKPAQWAWGAICCMWPCAVCMYVCMHVIYVMYLGIMHDNILPTYLPTLVWIMRMISTITSCHMLLLMMLLWQLLTIHSSLHSLIIGRFRRRLGFRGRYLVHFLLQDVALCVVLVGNKGLDVCMYVCMYVGMYEERE